MNVSYFPYWNIARYDLAISHSHVCGIIQGLYTRDWGISRLSQNQFPLIWVSNWRCWGALLSEHPAQHRISYVQASLAAVSVGHVCKLDLWSLVQYTEMRNMPSVTICEKLGFHSCSVKQLFPLQELLCSWGADAIQFPVILFKLP